MVAKYDEMLYRLGGKEEKLVADEIMERSLQKGTVLYEVRKAKRCFVRPPVYFMEKEFDKPIVKSLMLEIFDCQQAPFVSIGITLLDNYRLVSICDYSDKYKLLQRLGD